MSFQPGPNKPLKLTLVKGKNKLGETHLLLTKSHLPPFACVSPHPSCEAEKKNLSGSTHTLASPSAL